MDEGALATVVAKAAAQLRQWFALQEAVALLAANAGNILQRLPALQAARHYQGLPKPEELQRLVLSRTVAAFDNVLARLHAKLAEMEEVVRAQEKLSVLAWDAVGARASCSTCSQAQLSSGFSVAQLTEAVEGAWYMCRDEACLKAAAIARLHPGMPQEEFGAMQDLLQAGVHAKQDSSAALVLLS